MSDSGHFFVKKYRNGEGVPRSPIEYHECKHCGYTIEGYDTILVRYDTCDLYRISLAHDS